MNWLCFFAGRTCQNLHNPMSLLILRPFFSKLALFFQIAPRRTRLGRVKGTQAQRHRVVRIRYVHIRQVFTIASLRIDDSRFTICSMRFVVYASTHSLIYSSTFWLCFAQKVVKFFVIPRLFACFCRFFATIWCIFAFFWRFSDGGHLKGPMSYNIRFGRHCFAMNYELLTMNYEPSICSPCIIQNAVFAVK